MLAVLFGAALWYAQNYAYYSVTTPTDYQIDLTLNNGQMQPVLAHDFTILDADTSPLKFRACFHIDNSVAMLTETYRVYDNATPLKPPSWFDCFAYRQLSDDIRSGVAVAFLGQKNVSDGVDQVVAVYDDGRAFAWHQLNEKFADK